MAKDETIKIVFVDSQVEKLDDKYSIQFSGFVLSGKDPKRLRAWSLPFTKADEAQEKLDEFKLIVAKYGTMLLFNFKK